MAGVLRGKTIGSSCAAGRQEQGNEDGVSSRGTNHRPTTPSSHDDSHHSSPFFDHARQKKGVENSKPLWQTPIFQRACMHIRRLCRFVERVIKMAYESHCERASKLPRLNSGRLQRSRGTYTGPHHTSWQDPIPHLFDARGRLLPQLMDVAEITGGPGLTVVSVLAPEP